MTSKLRAQIEKAWRHSFRRTKRPFAPAPYRSKKTADVDRRADVAMAYDKYYRPRAQIVALIKLHAQNGRVKRGLPKSSNLAETKCLKWLVEKMERSPQRPNSKKIIQKTARQLFEGLSARGFDRAWQNAVAAIPIAKWNAPGAPVKRKTARPKNPRTN